VYESQGRLKEAERLYIRALRIQENASSKDRSSNAVYLQALADLYTGEERYSEAETLYKQAVDIWEGSLGPKSPAVAGVLESYVKLLRKMSRNDEAIRVEQRAKAIRNEESQNK
jgi:tetratricopeptide (TPR) repeat protein